MDDRELTPPASSGSATARTADQLVPPGVAAPSTPVEVLAASVMAVTGQQANTFVPLIGGQVNESYSVDTETGTSLVVRIARKGRRWFEDEATLMALARSVGVPTADVLGVQHFEFGGELLSISVQQRLEGDSLDQVARHMAPSELERLVADAGELLARVHSVTTEHGVQHGLEPPSPSTLAARAAIARRVGGDVAARLVDVTEEYLHSALAGMSRPAKSLAHGDWSTKHFLVRDGGIVGIVDWEQSGSGSPAFDLAWWDVFFDHRPSHSSDTLLRGYYRVTRLEPEVEAYRPLFAADWLLEMLGWYNGRHAPLVRHCLTLLDRLVMT